MPLFARRHGDIAKQFVQVFAHDSEGAVILQDDFNEPGIAAHCFRRLSIGLRHGVRDFLRRVEVRLGHPKFAGGQKLSEVGVDQFGRFIENACDLAEEFLASAGGIEVEGVDMPLVASLHPEGRIQMVPRRVEAANLVTPGFQREGKPVGQGTHAWNQAGPLPAVGGEQCRGELVRAFAQQEFIYRGAGGQDDPVARPAFEPGLDFLPGGNCLRRVASHD